MIFYKQLPTKTQLFVPIAQLVEQQTSRLGAFTKKFVK